MANIDFKQELILFFSALMFYTRIPIPAWVPYSEENQAMSARYFPLIGIMVGAAAGLTSWIATQIWAESIAIILAMISAILITGALHEDGFADMCDGFGGGWTQERILEIMKDSQVGVFGLIGLIMLLLLKFFALSQLTATLVPLALITAHTLSRAAAITFLNTHNYARADGGESKASAMVRPMRKNELVIVLITVLIPLPFCAIVFPIHALLFTLVAVVAIRWYLGKLFTRKIAGYTGDCLGAAQQVIEVAIYLALGV